MNPVHKEVNSKQFGTVNVFHCTGLQSLTPPLQNKRPVLKPKLEVAAQPLTGYLCLTDAVFFLQALQDRAKAHREPVIYSETHLIDSDNYIFAASPLLINLCLNSEQDS